MAVLAVLHFLKTKQSKKQYKTSKKPWISKAILTSVKTKNKLFRKLLKHKSDKSYEIYKVYGHMLTYTKKEAKVMYYQKLITNSKAPSDTWKAANDIIRRTKQRSNLPNSLQVNNRNLNDPFTICHELHEHFCNIGHKLAANTQTTRQHNSTMFFGQTMPNSFCLNPTDEYEIIGIINNPNANKSPGHDELPILLIKESKYAICSYLSKTLNKCLFNGHYPDILKIAKVTPIFKRGQRNDPNNYRPIFVLSPFNKIAITQLIIIYFMNKVLEKQYAQYFLTWLRPLIRD